MPLDRRADVSAGEASLAEVLGGAGPGPLSLSEILVDISDIEGSTVHLAPADIVLSTNELGLVQRIGRESLLRDALRPVSERYDYALSIRPRASGSLR